MPRDPRVRRRPRRHAGRIGVVSAAHMERGRDALVAVVA